SMRSSARYRMTRFYWRLKREILCLIGSKLRPCSAAWAGRPSPLWSHDMKGWIIIAGGFGAGLLALIAVFGVTWRSSDRPLEYYLDMKLQPRYRGQAESKFFADGRAMRLPVVGTVPFGGVDYLGSAGSPRLNPDLLQADDDLYRGKVDGKW